MLPCKLPSLAAACRRGIATGARTPRAHGSIKGRQGDCVRHCHQRAKYKEAGWVLHRTTSKGTQGRSLEEERERNGAKATEGPNPVGQEAVDGRKE